MQQQIVLIDDDINVCEHWERRLSRATRRILTFNSARQFNESSGAIPVSSLIFVDQNLSDGVDGVAVSRDLFTNGFRELYLCTSHHPEQFKSLSWIKGVVGKIPPGWLFEDEITSPLSSAERKNLVAGMTSDNLNLYKTRMEHFLNVAHGQDSGVFAGPSMDGFGLPDVVMNAWERAIAQGLSDETIKARVDHAWRVANQR